MLPILDRTFEDQVEKVKDLILQEVNIKEIEYISDTSGIIHKSVKPNFQTLGKRLGKYMKDASRLIAEMSQEDISKIEAENAFVLEIDNQKFDLTAEDVVIAAEDIPGWTVATDRNLTVALDIQLTDALLAEGTARELVNRIQNLRKSADLNVTDRIHVLLTETKEITDALLQFEDYIKSETLAESIEISSDFGGERTELQEGVWTEILVKKA